MLLHKKGFIAGGILLALSTVGMVSVFSVPKYVTEHRAAVIIKCRQHQQTLLKALTVYQYDHPKVFWNERLTIEKLRDNMFNERYILSKKVFECPSSITPGSNNDYAIVFNETGEVVAVECIEHQDHNIGKED